MIKVLKVTNDKKYIISSGCDKTVRLWNIDNGECIRSFDTDISAIDFCLYDDDRYIAVGGMWLKLSIFDFQTGKKVKDLKSMTGNWISWLKVFDQFLIAGNDRNDMVTYDTSSGVILNQQSTCDEVEDSYGNKMITSDDNNYLVSLMTLW